MASSLVAVWEGLIVSGFEFAGPKEWALWKKQLGVAAVKRGQSREVFPRGTVLMPYDEYLRRYSNQSERVGD